MPSKLFYFLVAKSFLVLLAWSFGIKMWLKLEIAPKNGLFLYNQYWEKRLKPTKFGFFRVLAFPTFGICECMIQAYFLIIFNSKLKRMAFKNASQSQVFSEQNVKTKLKYLASSFYTTNFRILFLFHFL